MDRKSFGKEMPSKRSELATDGENFKKQMSRSLDGAERTHCDSSRDVRIDGIKGNPFTPSAQGLFRKDLQASEKPNVASDPNLHSDTTTPGENTITSEPYEKRLTDSGEMELSRQQDKKVPDATKRKTFNS